MGEQELKDKIDNKIVELVNGNCKTNEKELTTYDIGPEGDNFETSCNKVDIQHSMYSSSEIDSIAKESLFEASKKTSRDNIGDCGYNDRSRKATDDYIAKKILELKKQLDELECYAKSKENIGNESDENFVERLNHSQSDRIRIVKNEAVKSDSKTIEIEDIKTTDPTQASVAQNCSSNQTSPNELTEEKTLSSTFLEDSGVRPIRQLTTIQEETTVEMKESAKEAAVETKINNQNNEVLGKFIEDHAALISTIVDLPSATLVDDKCTEILENARYVQEIEDKEAPTNSSEITSKSNKNVESLLDCSPSELHIAIASPLVTKFCKTSGQYHSKQESNASYEGSLIKIVSEPDKENKADKSTNLNEEERNLVAKDILEFVSSRLLANPVNIERVVNDLFSAWKLERKS